MTRQQPRKKPSRVAQTARTIRFPAALKRRLAVDAERCGRSFEAHVIAILRSHFGEHVDLSPAGTDVLAALRASAEGIPDADWEEMTARAEEQ